MSTYKTNDIIKLFNCEWQATTYTTDDSELYYKNRVRLVCIESHGNVYKVGDVLDFANTEK